MTVTLLNQHCGNRMCSLYITNTYLFGYRLETLRYIYIYNLHLYLNYKRLMTLNSEQCLEMKRPK